MKALVSLVLVVVVASLAGVAHAADAQGIDESQLSPEGKALKAK